MRTAIKVEHGEGESLSGIGQEEEADAGRERRRWPNQGACVVSYGTESLLAAHAEAQAHAFGCMEHAYIRAIDRAGVTASESGGRDAGCGGAA